jgi:hypothetical protein
MIELRRGVVARHANVGDAVDGRRPRPTIWWTTDELGGEFAGGASWERFLGCDD